MGVIQTKIKSVKKQISLKDKELIRERRQNIIKTLSDHETSESSSLISITSTTSSSSTSKSSIKFPSTNDDIDFLHQHHFIVKSIWSSNFSSSNINDILNNGGAKILDVLCGAGTFLLELSNEYQNSQFVGIDKNKLFPSEIKPNNLHFINENLLNGLPFEDDEFDFVHLNIIEPLYSLKQWDFIVKELLRVAKPGGSIEIQGFDFLEENIGPKFMKYIGYYMLLFETNELDMRPRDHLKSLFSNYLDSANHDDKSILLGKNGGHLGILLEQHATMFFKDTINEMLINLMDISINEFDQGWREILKEFDEFDTIIDTYRIWGIKKN
ncbi:S-adenosyl-L-methionine-dependent methyltransferase [Glomus cerebriforme]|uniref:S-adenosyl-L-methionine-dependent methyltransferase n=1 Tax=Glomus cerebriforme TaxID=658196 RepID=A0A397T2U0_9GLOM|nr:S-adenosyl-L-methionine-dependent methyltransferase [Glomus cerebriforme]